MADNDAQVELKKRARRRLVGAIALALAAAIVLPMVMDSEPKPTGKELEIRIPSQEGSNFAARVITGAAQVPAPPRLPMQSPAVAAPASAPAPTPAPQVTPQSGAHGDQTAKPVGSEKPRSVPRPAPAAAQSVTAANRVSEDVRARAILEGKPAVAIGKKLFFVQIGVYRDAGNAQDVAARAAKHGVSVASDKVGGATRVRVGPYQDRAAAESTATRLRSAGIAGIVVAK